MVYKIISNQIVNTTNPIILENLNCKENIIIQSTKQIENMKMIIKIYQLKCNKILLIRKNYQRKQLVKLSFSSIKLFAMILKKHGLNLKIQKKIKNKLKN
ncbi:unnamed protein product [Paramecium sonneborni]|uniref:Uncharacterized protein n=1 Tax=Paramecium sonneborni TaxID=65129 RepID=A0A8S1LX18_9CILI|nr:unnamed protein product [Paramecium sonneborni]